MNYKIILQYDGTKYSGWQKQGNSAKTIQGKLEAVLERMAGCPVEVTGSGRTDAGVHALAQTANFHLKERFEPAAVKRYLNCYLPEDICVVLAEEADERFHSRLNAVKKTYLYRVHYGEKKNVFERNYLYHSEGRPDCLVMREAAKHLIGEHDFKSFCNNKNMKKSTVRTLYEINIQEEEENELKLYFTGNGFLYNMVRILSGTLLETGLAARKAGDMPAVIAAKNRMAAGITLPPQGLFLVNVEF